MNINRDTMTGLDFETYGATDLPTYGLHRYTSCSTFRPLIASTAVRRDSRVSHGRYDFVENFDQAVYLLAEHLNNYHWIVAHNAPFEQRVLATMGIYIPSNRFIDSAVIARAMGAGGSLEAAAPQLLNVNKYEAGKALIKLFSIPGKYQEENGTQEFDPRIVVDHPTEWEDFGTYCDIDAELGLDIAIQNLGDIIPVELDYQTVTMEMNNTGWPVDVPLVEEMQRRYLDNMDEALRLFRVTHDADDLNLNSLKQMKEWCEARGIKAKSFDQKAVEKMMAAIDKKLTAFDDGSATPAPGQYEGYCDVMSLLETKRTIGGSSLKKLQVILDTTGKDMRLKDQYLHIGASQSYRTTGRSVQMQNLKRLGNEIEDMSELDDPANEWDNDKLAANLRQCFTSSHEQGFLIVGDFKSVESRGLAWAAGARWKIEAYRQGLDLYKVQAETIYGVPYDQVTKEQRQTGKVGELSCGYQAGGGAVQSFAAGMGITMTEAEASKLVTDWRATNPEVVRLWQMLDDALQNVMAGSPFESVWIGQGGWSVTLGPARTPVSLLTQHPKGAQSIVMSVVPPGGEAMLRRYFHGCYLRGRNVCFYKPSQRKTGDLWSSHFVDPKTKQVRWFTIYGGKLAGILTQSFCRELFFRSLLQVHRWSQTIDNVDLIGQFHDEIVLDWRPPVAGAGHGQIDLAAAEFMLNQYMSDASGIPGFPLEADIKHDYRYTK